jgi:hypothetical protein
MAEILANTYITKLITLMKKFLVIVIISAAFYFSHSITGRADIPISKNARKKLWQHIKMNDLYL